MGSQQQFFLNQLEFTGIYWNLLERPVKCRSLLNLL